MHPLDNVIWQALTTRQAQFAEAFDGARRFVRKLTLPSAFEEPTADGYSALAGLVSTDTTAVFLDKPYETRPAWDFVAGAPLLQMVCENGTRVRTAEAIEIVDLGPPDSSEMLELTTLTKPGPFGPRTH